VLNVVTGSGQGCGSSLVRHPDVKRIAFIGSVSTGKQIARDAADGGIKVVTLELGGKNPLIVLPDADVASAADGATTGMNLDWTLGQSCGSTSRVFVPAEMHDSFVAEVQQRFESLAIGMPTDPETQVGCLISPAHVAKVQRFVQSGIDDGATLVTGGRPPDDVALSGGSFYLPTLFADVRHSMRIAQEEIFGPVLSVIPWRDEAEMLDQVNDVSYGLTANIWTNDLRAAHRLAEEVEAGFVWVNGDGRHFAGAPFGGYKSSGVGVEESLDELLSYTQSKNVSVFL
jgi:betaine-aldehyde dehydrogenase